MNMRSQIMICIKLKLVPKRFMRMPQTQNSQAGWIKFKCNDSSWEQPLHILGMMKWMIDGAESGKIFKTLLICCVLGKYDASYSCLFCCSYETFETDFPICEIFISNLNLRNYNNETSQTLQISFLNYLFINKAKFWDLRIIIIISFSILIAFRIILILYLYNINRLPYNAKWLNCVMSTTRSGKVCKLFLIRCAPGEYHSYLCTVN